MDVWTYKQSLAVLLSLTLAAVGLWAGAAEEVTAAAEKEMVRNVRGELVEKPQYGGILSVADTGAGQPRMQATDPWHDYTAPVNNLVLEKLGMPDWKVSPEEYRFSFAFFPMELTQGWLAESWEQPDPLTIIFHVRRGVHWHDKAPMNGRELTAKDVEFTWHRLLGMGSGFTEQSAVNATLTQLPIVSVQATDDWTVEVKSSEFSFQTLRNLVVDLNNFVQPPEVIQQYGNLQDWRTLVGTGPFELTDIVEGSALTFTKYPNYWAFDENHPDNRLPYLDEINILLMPDFSTRMAALRTGKIAIGREGSIPIDQVESIQRTNPELKLVETPGMFTVAVRLHVADLILSDIRVRMALQKALDLDAIGETYYKGYADPTPWGFGGPGPEGYYTPFDEWPEAIKAGYRYDAEEAERLLGEAGYPRGADGIRFSKNYDVSEGWGMDVDLAQVLKAYWAEIGVDVSINVVEAGLMFDRFKTATYGGMTYGELRSSENYPASQNYRSYHSTGRWGDVHGSHDSVGDALLDKANAATDIEDYKQWTKDAELHFAGQHYNLWLPNIPRFIFHQPWLHGYYGQWEHQDNTLYFTRLWIDGALREEMGH